MDLLSDVLHTLHMTGTLYFRTAFTAPWGVEVPAYQNVARFHYVQRGRCFVRVADANRAVCLEQGDLIIITRGASHVLSDPSYVVAKTLDTVVEESGYQGQGALVYGEAQTGHSTQLVCGHFSFDLGARHVLLDALPPYVHISDFGKVSPLWLSDTLRLISSEAGHGHLGSDYIALKLTEVIFAQAIRHYVDTHGKDQPGLAGFADTHIRRALQAIHDKPDRAWSVEHLATVAGMSRTRFAQQFNTLVGSTPLAYLTAWRMQVARKLLAETDLPMIDVATQSGYQSEASFGRIFKRFFDIPPAVYRRSVSQRSER
ncbi:MAG: AraC family transcriptional regulator [Pseudomonadota bacterium]